MTTSLRQYLAQATHPIDPRLLTAMEHTPTVRVSLDERSWEEPDFAAIWAPSRPPGCGCARCTFARPSPASACAVYFAVELIALRATQAANGAPIALGALGLPPVAERHLQECDTTARARWLVQLARCCDLVAAFLELGEAPLPSCTGMLVALRRSLLMVSADVTAGTLARQSSRPGRFGALPTESELLGLLTWWASEPCFEALYHPDDRVDSLALLFGDIAPEDAPPILSQPARWFEDWEQPYPHHVSVITQP